MHFGSWKFRIKQVEKGQIITVENNEAIIRYGEGLTLQTSASSFYGGNLSLFDTKASCFTSSRKQHHSFFRN